MHPSKLKNSKWRELPVVTRNLVRDSTDLSPIVCMWRDEGPGCGDEVVMEDWVLDTFSEDAEPSNEGCLLPLSVEPLAFPMPLGAVDNYYEG